MIPQKPFFTFFFKSCGIFSVSLLLIYAGLLFLRPIETEDIWWHLKAGEYIFHHHQVPRVDPFVFASEQTRWILTQWLGSLIYFLVYRLAGFGGLQIFRVLLFLLVVVIFLRFARKKVPLVWAVLLTFLFIQSLSYRVLLRPFVFNFIFMEIFLISLLAYQRHPRPRYLIVIAFSNLAWVNIHLGSFMYGLPLTGIFFLAALMEAFRERRVAVTRQLRGLGTLLIAQTATHFLTPYGIDGALHPWRTLFIKDYIYFRQLSDSIAELLPPPLLTGGVFWWFFVLLFLDAAAIALTRQDKFLKLVLVMFSTALFVISRRGCVFSR